MEEKDRLDVYARLREAGMTDVPAGFSVACLHQEIAPSTLAGIDAFIRVFDRVTTRPAWQEAVTRAAPEIARQRRPEVCFFSAWDFHLPPGRPEGWELIECNDNGSGFLFAALVNRLFHEVSDLGGREDIEPPPAFPALAERVVRMVEEEARRFFGAPAPGLFLVLDDGESLRSGKFRHELFLLRDLFRGRGWEAEVGSPAEVRLADGHLLLGTRPVAFVVNRSTDFFWQTEVFVALRAAYRAGTVYVAPNPFTYATRSDKRLLELLSRPGRDDELGIESGERAMLSARVPETWVLREDNVDALAGRKQELVFKPARGFAGHGVLPSAQVGRARLRRLLKRGEVYVAQSRVPKSYLVVEEAPGGCLWTDLRVWAHRGERFLISGRASRRPDLIDLRPPGGWLPTYVGTGPPRP